MSDWKALAKKCAAIYGAPERIVLSTVEAETGGQNELGDAGRAFGYGQVWLKWHYSKLVKAAADMNIKIPAQPNSAAEEEKFKPIILGNDELSMRLAVLVIKGYWDSANGDWVSFTKGYVGPAIPASDLERRRKIWVSYGGTTPAGNVTGGLPDVSNLTDSDLKKYAAVGLAVVAAVALIGGR